MVELRASHLAKEVLKLQQADTALLGVYRDRAGAAKRRERWLREQGAAPKSAVKGFAEELLEGEVRALLLDLDVSWWSLRAELDRYLTAANAQISAFTAAATMLEAHVSKCSLGSAQARKSYYKAAAAERKSRSQLQDAWTTSLPLLGLLVAKIVDARALGRFAQHDMRAAISDPALLGESGLKELCSWSSTKSRQAKASLRAELVAASKRGLFGQTAQQLEVAFQEMLMLKERFENQGMAEPAGLDDVATALHRAQSAYNSTVASLPALADDMAAVMLQGMC